MIRYDAIKEIMEVTGNHPVICNIGAPSKEIYQINDRPQNFYMLGSMGLASSIGLGISLVKSSMKVIVIDGDGSILMNLGSLTTIGKNCPSNLLLIIIDNGSYGSTGFQPTFTQDSADLEVIAKGCGIRNSQTITEKGDIKTKVKTAIASTELELIIIKTEIGAPKINNIPLNALEIKNRFISSLENL
ncbi:MAG: sulfopyruvate decarboxylase subunit beta [Candidatus Hodarchaeales archaeon]|jgi:sulfopyruvate decarboxylase subunit beta